MVAISHLVRFECEEDGSSCFTDLGRDANGPPSLGDKLTAYASLEDLQKQHNPRNVTVRKVGRFSSPFT